jgi:hypothetical protein
MFAIWRRLKILGKNGEETTWYAENCRLVSVGSG